MNIKKLLLATVAGFIVMQTLGMVTHLMVLKNWYEAHAGAAGNLQRHEPLMPYLMLGGILLSFIMAYLYPKGVESDNKIMEGLKFGVIMGVAWIIPFQLILYGVTTIFSGTSILTDLVVHSVEQGIGGIVIALVYGNEPWELRKK